MGIGEFIFSWVKDLTLLFVIITLVDLVMPKGSMSRYINFVIGLLIIFTVVNPIINLTNIDFQLDKEVFKNFNEMNHFDEDILREQNNQIEFLYKERISKEIKTFVEENTNYNVSILDLKINMDKEEFGGISYLNITIKDIDKKDNKDNIEIQVSPVILEYNKGRDVKDDFLEIKELISTRYEIDKNIIDISTIKLED